MVNYCTECGYKIQPGFRFCPNCGSEIATTEISSLKNESSLEKVEIIVCTNCGDENPLDSSTCNSCGISLTKGQIKTSTPLTKKGFKGEVNSEKRKVLKSSSLKNKKPINTSTLEAKKLDIKIIYAFIGGIAGLVILILFFSGTINLSGNETPVSKVNQQNLDSGINLNELSRINELKSLIEKQPSIGALILELANLQFDSGFFEEASRNYSKYLQLDPINADARIDMAVCFYNMGQFDKAEAEVIEALKYSPNHQTGYLNLGIINLAKQNLEKAKEWFNKTIKINPNTELANRAKSLLETH